MKSFLGGRGERGLPVTYLLCQWGAGRGGGFKICPILGFAFKDQFPTVDGNRDLILLYVNLYCTSVSLRQYCTQIPSPHYPSFFISTPLQNYPSAYSLLIISIFSLSTHPRIQTPPPLSKRPIHTSTPLRIIPAHTYYSTYSPNSISTSPPLFVSTPSLVHLLSANSYIRLSTCPPSRYPPIHIAYITTCAQCMYTPVCIQTPAPVPTPPPGASTDCFSLLH